MATNVVFLGWDHPTAGREAKAVELFQENHQYLTSLQQAGTIQSFESVLLNPHGGDLNGFTLIRGESGKLDDLLSSEQWEMFMIRAGLLVDGFGLIRGVSGDLLMKQMGIYSQASSA